MTLKDDKKASHIRHLSYQIVAQLPEDTGEALLVLEYAKRVLLHPLDQGTEPVPLKLVERGENGC